MRSNVVVNESCSVVGMVSLSNIVINESCSKVTINSLSNPNAGTPSVASAVVVVVELELVVVVVEVVELVDEVVELVVETVLDVELVVEVDEVVETVLEVDEVVDTVVDVELVVDAVLDVELVVETVLDVELVVEVDEVVETVLEVDEVVDTVVVVVGDGPASSPVAKMEGSQLPTKPANSSDPEVGTLSAIIYQAPSEPDVPTFISPPPNQAPTYSPVRIAKAVKSHPALVNVHGVSVAQTRADPAVSPLDVKKLLPSS